MILNQVLFRVVCHTLLEDLSKLETLYLAHGRLGDLGDVLDTLGPQALLNVLRLQVIGDLLQRGLVLVAGDGERADALTQSLVGHADGGRLKKPGALHQIVIDLASA